MKKFMVICGFALATALFGFTSLDLESPASPHAYEITLRECFENCLPSAIHISEYGRQAAEEFLIGFTSMFVNVYMEWAEWDRDTNIPRRSGQFTRFRGQGELYDFFEYVPQGITFSPIEEEYRGGLAFYHVCGNRVYEAPWLLVHHESDWTTYHFADYFRLFDFDGSGVPDIFIHFMQTFVGGYAGFYRIFRYVDGEYRMLEIKAFDEYGELLPRWMGAWIGRAHEILRDSYGRLIVFIDSMYHGMEFYQQLILTETHAELHFLPVVTVFDYETWLDWQKHHWPGFVQRGPGWSDWSDAVSWLDYCPNPTIFGTDITIERVESLVELEQEIYDSIRELLGLTNTNPLVGAWEITFEVDHDIQGIYFWESIVFYADGYGEFLFPYGSVSTELFRWRTDGNVVYYQIAAWKQELDSHGHRGGIDEGPTVWWGLERRAYFRFYNDWLIFYDGHEEVVELARVNESG